MLNIAKKLNFSETVFIQSIDNEKKQIALKYVTPGGEVDLCGHATVASLGYLHTQNLLWPSEEEVIKGVLDTKSGLVEFVIECSPIPSHAKVFMQQMELTKKPNLTAE